MAAEQHIARLLEETAKPDKVARTAAEQSIGALSKQPGFVIALLKIQEAASVSVSTKILAAVFFKNFVKTNWNEDCVVEIPEADKAQVRAVLMSLMLSVEPRLQRIFSEALSIISECDFPSKWPSLLPELVSKLNTQDHNVLNGVLKTAHSIFKKYQHSFGSDEIVSELKIILATFAPTYAGLFETTANAIKSQSDPNALRVLFSEMLHLTKIFFSLNSVTIPEFFEDRLPMFMTVFKEFLEYKTTLPVLLESENEDKPGLLLKVQAQICKSLNMYIEKYDEEFSTYVAPFAGVVWNLLTQSKNTPNYDSLVNGSIKFLTNVSKGPNHGLFATGDALKTICTMIIIPNMRLRESDEEMFEDNPIEYIRKDVEGNDADTRRSAALELVKGLRKNYEAQVTNLLIADITNMIAEYTKNPQSNWHFKDTAIYLVTALTVRSATAAGGTTSTNELVPLLNFFETQIVPELSSASPSPILKADLLKFVLTFRAQLPQASFMSVFPQLTMLLGDPNFVICSYAALCIERLLTVRDAGALRFAPMLKPNLQAMLTALFAALNRQTHENEYLMKAIMRVLSVSGVDIVPMASACVGNLMKTLEAVCKNPANPSFNHYLFEVLGIIIGVVANIPDTMKALEVTLLPPFQRILQEDIIEFTPYVFQLMAMMLEHTTLPVSPNYTNMYAPLMTAGLWERPANVPGLVRLLQAYLSKCPEVPAANIIPTLGVFSKLNSSNATDSEGFLLLQSLIQHTKPVVFEQHLGQIIGILFTKYMRVKGNIKYAKGLSVFFSLIIVLHGPSFFITQIDKVQAQLFKMVMDGILIPNIPKVDDIIDRKVCSLALVKLLTESPEMMAAYSELWGTILNALLRVLELPADETVIQPDAEENQEGDAPSGGGEDYGVAYSRLNYAKKDEVDLFPGVNPKELLARSLQQLSARHPGMVAGVVQRSLTPEASAVLSSYFTAAGVPALS